MTFKQLDRFLFLFLVQFIRFSINYSQADRTFSLATKRKAM